MPRLLSLSFIICSVTQGQDSQVAQLIVRNYLTPHLLELFPVAIGATESRFAVFKGVSKYGSQILVPVVLGLGTLTSEQVG